MIPLLALGLQPVGQQRKVHHSIPAPAGTLLNGEKLVLKDALGVIEETSNECGFSVIDGTCGGKT